MRSGLLVIRKYVTGRQIKRKPKLRRQCHDASATLSEYPEIYITLTFRCTSGNSRNSVQNISVALLVHLCSTTWGAIDMTQNGSKSYVCRSDADKTTKE